jgi:hypothetical protein
MSALVESLAPADLAFTGLASRAALFLADQEQRLGMRNGHSRRIQCSFFEYFFSACSSSSTLMISSKLEALRRSSTSSLRV